MAGLGARLFLISGVGWSGFQLEWAIGIEKLNICVTNQMILKCRGPESLYGIWTLTLSGFISTLRCRFAFSALGPPLDTCSFAWSSFRGFAPASRLLGLRRFRIRSIRTNKDHTHPFWKKRTLMLWRAFRRVALQMLRISFEYLSGGSSDRKEPHDVVVSNT